MHACMWSLHVMRSMHMMGSIPVMQSIYDIRSRYDMQYTIDIFIRSTCNRCMMYDRYATRRCRQRSNEALHGWRQWWSNKALHGRASDRMKRCMGEGIDRWWYTIDVWYTIDIWYTIDKWYATRRCTCIIMTHAIASCVKSSFLQAHVGKTCIIINKTNTSGWSTCSEYYSCLH
jgi:hypothetical protein